MSGFYTRALKYITSFVADLRSITGAEHDHCKLKTRFEMFRKSNLNFVLICLLLQSTASASVKPKNFSGVKSNFSNSHDLPETVDQTFNINNWGLGKIERKLLLDIKAKVDSFFSKCKATVSECPKGWVSRGKSCYLVIDVRVLKWSEARRTCQNLGGDLAVIKSANENKFIFDLVKKQKTVTSYGVWLGLYRKADNKFYWVDGTPEAGQYSTWAKGEPSSFSEKCALMYGATSLQGTWNDLSCNRSYSRDNPVILCQKKAN